jgi:tRNA dimethylallyltransferase
VSLSSISPLVAVLGPTGSGKSELALQAALRFGGEIVNCDSLQVYRHLNIGTAKVRAEDQRGVPHHLLDVVNPDELFTAGEYARRARPVLNEIAARSRLPIVVGGTGLYLRALLEGLSPAPARDAALRARLAARESRRRGSLHRLLSRLDPPAAGRIHPGDARKLIRALEVRLLTRRPLSSVFAAGRDPLPGFRWLKLALDPPREALYRRLDARCEAMFSGGLLEEVRRVLALGFSETSKPLEAHGYRQAVQLLKGELDLQQALCHAQRNTRRYAKRQRTWFRREPDVVWIPGFGDQPEAQEAARRIIEDFLAGF